MATATLPNDPTSFAAEARRHIRRCRRESRRREGCTGSRRSGCSPTLKSQNRGRGGCTADSDPTGLGSTAAAYLSANCPIIMLTRSGHIQLKVPNVEFDFDARFSNVKNRTSKVRLGYDRVDMICTL